jgi:hypothetical protein
MHTYNATDAKQCSKVLCGSLGDMNEYQKKMKSLSKLHENLVFCLEHIGLYGALHVSPYLSSFSQIYCLELYYHLMLFLHYHYHFYFIYLFIIIFLSSLSLIFEISDLQIGFHF